jgi:hypothetical protein
MTIRYAEGSFLESLHTLCRKLLWNFCLIFFRKLYSISNLTLCVHFISLEFQRIQIVKTDFFNGILAVFNTYIMNTESLQTINQAAASGDLQLLISLHNQGQQLEEGTLEIAAENGHLHILQYFRHSWNANVIRAAAQAGHLHIVKYLHENGCPWDHKVTAGAANVGHLHCLKYLHENNCPWDEWATAWAARGDELECLKYLHQNGCPWDYEAIEVASRHGNLDCLQYLHQNGCVIEKGALQYAAENGHLDCVKYLCESLPQLEDDDTYWVAKSGHLDCLQRVIENGAEYYMKDILNCLNDLTLDFDQTPWLRNFLFPHIDSDIMPQGLNDICKQKLAQINLVKQATQVELSDTVSLDVVKHCLHSFI